MSASRRWAVCVGLFGLSLALRLSFLLLVFGWRAPLDGDEHDYHGIAANWVEGRGWSEPSDPAEYRLPEHACVARQGFEPPSAHRSARPPLVPLVVGLVYRWGGIDPGLARLTLLILASLIAPALWLVGLELWHPRWEAALVTALAWCVYPYAVFDAKGIMTESLAALLVVAATGCYLKSARSGSAWLAAATGVAWGLLTQDRSNYLLLPPVIVALGALARPATPWRWTRRQAAVGLAACTLLLAPWTLRNYLVHGAFMPVTSDLGRLLLACNDNVEHPLVQAGGYYHDPKLRGLMESYPERMWTRVGARLTLEHLGANAPRLPAIVLRRAKNFWHYRLDPYEHLKPRKASRSGARVQAVKQFRNAVMAAAWLPVLAAFLASLWRFSWRDAWPLLATIGYALLMTLPFWGTPRFRFPVEGLIFLIAARWVDAGVSGRLRRRALRSEPRPPSPVS